MQIRILMLALAFGISSILSGCSTTQAEFQRNPKAVSKAALCRAFLESGDPYFRKDLAAELFRRGLNPYDCAAMVQQQNQAAAALVAVALIGTAVAVCANNNCGGSSYPAYRGNCQYDWQYDAAGRRCGGRSAYSRPGGY
ncbi:MULTISPECIES: hypothetical protein [unclassified Rhizobium]|uniref:hypothetical protein n=1 Tax=unclassified Rhizobium TaxID=2613769 RepID=UPI0009EBB096|nr:MULTISPECIES: hypothetical protein [unclassified Rhizobium]